jgi:NitT/TauT family transport system substrate-binding protein
MKDKGGVMRLRAILAIAAMAFVVGCGGDEGGAAAGEGGNVTLTLNWIPYGEHAPFYYGLQQGFYEDEGIKLTVRPGNGSSRTVEQVAAGQTTVGWADTPAMLLGASNGMPIKSIGAFMQKGPSSIEYFAEQGIESPEDLKGKTVAGTPGDAMYASFPGWLEANGLSQDDVKVVNVDPAGKLAALIEGKADAIMGFFHDQGPTIENQSGEQVDALMYSDWGMNLLGTGLVVNESTIESNPDLLRSFVRATRKSWEAAAENPEAAADAMVAMAEQEPPKEVLVKQLNLTLPLVVGEGMEPGVNDEAAWRETIKLMTDHVELDGPAEPAEYWDASFATG